MKISEDYEVSRDKYQWILTEWYDGKNKDGDLKRKSRQTYHGSLRQVASQIVDSVDIDCLDAYIERAERIKGEIAASLESANPN